MNQAVITNDKTIDDIFGCLYGKCYYDKYNFLYHIDIFFNDRNYITYMFENNYKLLEDYNVFLLTKNKLFSYIELLDTIFSLRILKYYKINKYKKAFPLTYERFYLLTKIYTLAFDDDTVNKLIINIINDKDNKLLYNLKLTNSVNNDMPSIDMSLVRLKPIIENYMKKMLDINDKEFKQICISANMFDIKNLSNNLNCDEEKKGYDYSLTTPTNSIFRTPTDFLVTDNDEENTFNEKDNKKIENEEVSTDDDESLQNLFTILFNKEFDSM